MSPPRIEEKPSLVLIDVDGILTDGRFHIDHTGEKLFKSFHTRDVRAIRELVFNGYEITLISADDWPGLNFFAEKVGADVLFLREKEKLPESLLKREFIAIGDDAWDVPMLKRAKLAFCPSDADASVMRLPSILPLHCQGGAGVIAHLVRYLLT